MVKNSKIIYFGLGLFIFINVSANSLPNQNKFEPAQSEVIDSTPFVGIYITENETGEGAKVSDVIPNGPAARAGIKRGDIIIELTGKKITDVEFLLAEISKTKPGQKLNFKIRRKGKIIPITVETVSRPKSIVEERPGGLINKIVETLRGGRNYLGIKGCDIIPGLDEYFGTETGVLIIQTIKDGFAEKVGLKPGDVIIALDETLVSDVKTLNDLLKQKTPGSTITLKLLRHQKTMVIKGTISGE